MVELEKGVRYSGRFEQRSDFVARTESGVLSNLPTLEEGSSFVLNKVGICHTFLVRVIDKKVILSVIQNRDLSRLIKIIRTCVRVRNIFELCIRFDPCDTNDYN